LPRAGTPIKEIVRRTGCSRKLVREIVRGGGGDVFRSRSNSLEPDLAWLDAEWAAGFCSHQVSEAAYGSSPDE
jgi:hypothetical protein